MIDLAKVPPQDTDVEKAVLGAILIDRECYDLASQILKPECFYSDVHQRVFRAFTELNHRSQPIDTLTLKDQLAKTGELEQVGGLYFLTTLTNTVVSSANIERHAQIIFEKHLLREQIKICGEGLVKAYENPDAFDCLDHLQAQITELAMSNNPVRISGITDLLVERFKRIEELRHRPDHLTGVPTGFEPIDKLTAGWQASDLIIIAARPSVGKTAFALNLAVNAAKHRTKPTPVAIFSLEMSKGQLTDRLLSAESGIDLDLITRAKMNDSDMENLFSKGVQRLANYKIFIDDTPALNIYDLKTRCRKLKKNENVGLIILDYLQLMSGMDGKVVNRNQNREQEISNISRNLKALAKELNIPVIALSQLSRELEKQKRDPQLSDLRESGAIEQDADMVCFLTRPDYQISGTEQTIKIEVNGKIEEYDVEAIKHLGDLHIKKHRNGDLAKIPLNHVLRIQRWMSTDQYDIYTRNLGQLTPIVNNYTLNNYTEPKKDDEDPF